MTTLQTQLLYRVRRFLSYFLLAIARSPRHHAAACVRMFPLSPPAADPGGRSPPKDTVQSSSWWWRVPGGGAGSARGGGESLLIANWYLGGGCWLLFDPTRDARVSYRILYRRGKEIFEKGKVAARATPGALAGRSLAHTCLLNP